MEARCACPARAQRMPHGTHARTLLPCPPFSSQPTSARLFTRLSMPRRVVSRLPLECAERRRCTTFSSPTCEIDIVQPPVAMALVADTFFFVYERRARDLSRSRAPFWSTSRARVDHCLAETLEGRHRQHRRPQAGHIFGRRADAADAARHGRRRCRDRRRDSARAAPFSTPPRPPKGRGGSARRREGRGRPTWRAPAVRGVGTECPEPRDRARRSYGAGTARVPAVRDFCITFVTFMFTRRVRCEYDAVKTCPSVCTLPETYLYGWKLNIERCL